MRRSIVILLSALISFTLFLLIEKVFSADSTVNYKNQPPPSAISPSVQSYSQMICSFPVTGAVQTSVVGISSGTTFTDWHCERRMLSQTLSKAGLKVASVTILCIGSKDVWASMLHSGTPCSIWNGQRALIGKEAINYYKEKGYIDDKGNILRYPSYVGVNDTSDNSDSRRNIKYPR